MSLWKGTTQNSKVCFAHQWVRSLEAFAKLATAFCSRRLDYKTDLSSPIATAMGFVEIDFLLFAGASHAAIASFAKASLLWKISVSLFLAMATSALSAQEPYHFYGRHLIAQYYDCDHAALCDIQQLSAAMKQATAASGACLLGTADYTFEGNGYTMVLLLSESHASIHTYPEYNACFVDLFTCGKKCSAAKFDAALREYLKPKRVDSKLQERG